MQCELACAGQSGRRRNHVADTAPDLELCLRELREEGIGVAAFTIEYGTDPSNLDQSLATLDNPFGMLPALVPETQYYWRVKVQDEFGAYTGTMTNFSEIRTFTTEGALPVEESTWGAVKALYQ